MIMGVRQALWRKRHLVVMAPESGHVHVVVFEETLRGLMFRLTRRFSLDIQSTGGVSRAEHAAWKKFVREYREESWIILLPHQATISQWLQLDQNESNQLQQRLEDQTKRLAGLGDSQIIIDHEEIPAAESGHSAYWITYCQESEIQKIIRQYGLDDVSICDVLASMDALMAGLRFDGTMEGEWVLVDVRDGGTAVAVFDGVHPRYASFFPIGNEMALEKGTRKAGPIRVGVSPADSVPLCDRIIHGIPLIADEWNRDIHRAWNEYRNASQHESKSSPMVVPLLVMAEDDFRKVWEEALEPRFEVRLLDASKIWKTSIQGLDFIERRHWGGAMPTQRKNLQIPSLLPESVKSAWNEKQLSTVMRSMAFLSCIFAMLVMVLAGIQKTMLWRMKSELIEELHGIEGKVGQSLLVMEALKKEYGMLRPLIHVEHRTIAALKILRTMQEVQAEHNGWMVLLADKDSYYASDVEVLTKSATLTNQSSFTQTNQVELSEGFIMETVLNSEGEIMRDGLADLVGFLKSRDYLVNADILPTDTRRLLVDTNVVIAGKHFSISLELEPVAEVRSTKPGSMENDRDAGHSPVWRNLQPDIKGTSTASPSLR
jgi:hypothetical protein